MNSDSSASAASAPRFITDKKWLAVLLVGAALAFGVRAVIGVSVVGLGHDESVSQLSAAGKQAAWREHVNETGGPPVGQRVRASEWQEWLRADEPFVFSRIAGDLSTDDIHPPLYFWLLHVGMLGSDSAIWTGRILNAGIAMITFFVMAGFARFMLPDSRWLAVFAAAAFAFSPATIQVSSLVRQYEILMLLSTATAFLFLFISEKSLREIPRWIWAALVFLVMAGFLTHYYFPLILATVFAVFAVRSWWRLRNLKLIVMAGAMCVVGVVGMLAIHASVLTAVKRQQSQAQVFDISTADGRLLQAVTDILQFVAPFYLMKQYGIAVVLAIGLAVGVGCAVVVWQWRRSRPAESAESVPNLRGRWMALGGIAALHFAFYAGFFVSFIFPRHAIGIHYYCHIWPLFALAVAGAVKISFGAKSDLAAKVGSGLLVGAGVLQMVVVAGNPPYLRPAGARPMPPIEGVLVVDSLYRGLFGEVITAVPPDTEIIAAPLPILAAKLEAGAVANDRAVTWVPIETEQTTPADVERVKRLLESQFAESEFVRGVWIFRQPRAMLQTQSATNGSSQNE